MALSKKDPVELIGGPYRTPRCRIGGYIRCERHGRVKVQRLTDAPVPWPMASRPGGHTGVPSSVRRGALIRAIRLESTSAVSHFFGLSKNVVRLLRREYGVLQRNDGTRALMGKRTWKPKEDALLGKVSDWQVSQRTGRTLAATMARRLELGIPAICVRSKPHVWTLPQDVVVWHFPPKEAAKRLRLRTTQVNSRRAVLRGRQRNHGKPATPPSWIEEVRSSTKPA